MAVNVFLSFYFYVFLFLSAGVGHAVFLALRHPSRLRG